MVESEQQRNEVKGEPSRRAKLVGEGGVGLGPASQLVELNEKHDEKDGDENAR